jgi:hypothetical protein
MGNQIPLDPGIGGRSIGAGALVNADIIVSTTRAGVSGIIRVGTASEVSHATLYEEGGWVIEKQGVVLRTLTEALADDVLAVAYRNPSVTHSTGQLILNYASKYIGQPYSIRGAVTLSSAPTRITRRSRSFSREHSRGRGGRGLRENASPHGDARGNARRPSVGRGSACARLDLHARSPATAIGSPQRRGRPCWAGPMLQCGCLCMAHLPTLAWARSRPHLAFLLPSRASSMRCAMRLDCCLNNRTFARGRP